MEKALGEPQTLRASRSITRSKKKLSPPQTPYRGHRTAKI